MTTQSSDHGAKSFKLSRRRFLGGVAGAAMGGIAARATRAADKPADVRVAVIGVRTQGWNHTFEIHRNVTAFCDVDRNVLESRADEFAARYGRRPDTFTDYRDLLARSDVDAVSIATPNHTHAWLGIAAAAAGKDVYVEKPAAHGIWEGRQLAAAALRYDRIIQCGTQSRSSASLHEARSFVQRGELGAVRYALGTCYKSRMSIGKLSQPLAIPASIDYDLWCGPAEKREIYRPQLHYDWHWDFNTGNGDLGNQGIHQMDVARWFLGEAGMPPRVLSVGGRLGYDDAGDTPNSQVILLDYPRAPLVFEVRGLPRSKPCQDPSLWPSSMDAFRGSQIGVVVQCEGGYVVIPNYNEATAFDDHGKQIQHWNSPGNAHHDNWLRAVADHDPTMLNAPIAEGHVSSALCHAGNISYQLGQKLVAGEVAAAVAANDLMALSVDRLLEHLRANGVDVDGKPAVTLGADLAVDPATETFVDNASANSLRTRAFRDPYGVPDLEATSVARSS